MSASSKSDFDKLLESILAARNTIEVVVGIILSGISLFTFNGTLNSALESLAFTVAMAMVSIILTCRFLLEIFTRRASKTTYRYPLATRVLALAGLILLVAMTGFWIRFGVVPHIQRNLPPSTVVELPSGESAALSVALDTHGFSWYACGSGWSGIITDGTLDSESTTPTIHNPHIEPLGLCSTNESSPVVTLPDIPAISRLMITGKDVPEPPYVSTEVPIKVVSFEPITEVVDLAIVAAGGGGDPKELWLLQAHVSDRALSAPDQIIHAKYNTRLPEILASPDNEIDKKSILESFPQAFQEAIESDVERPPLGFDFEQNSREIFSMAMFFEPGIYQLRIGAEYSYGGKKYILWAKPDLKVYVLKHYNLWLQDSDSSSQNQFQMVQSCTLSGTNAGQKYNCTDPQ